MNLERIVYLTEANYDTLVANDTVTVNGQTVNYSANDLYITPLNLSTNSPTTSGTDTEFITTISQNAAGKIFATKAGVALATTSANGLLSSTDKLKLDNAAELIASNVLSTSVTGTTNVEDALSSLQYQINGLSPDVSSLLTNVSSLTSTTGVLSTTVNSLSSLTSSQIIICDTTVAIPAQGSSVSKNLSGLTNEHRLIAWNFSSSGEDIPPVTLTWTTYDGYFTIANNRGSTSETIKPVFALPIEKTVSNHT